MTLQLCGIIIIIIDTVKQLIFFLLYNESKGKKKFTDTEIERLTACFNVIR